MIRLLIVDDESAARNGMLRHMDWKALGVDMVQAAASGPEGIGICENFQPDIVLSDIRMRGMNGVEMCKILRERYPACRIIFISGYSDKEYLKAAIEIGATDYVEKPVDKEELRRAVQKAMRFILEERRTQKNWPAPAESKAYIKREAFFLLLRGGESDEELRQIALESGLFRKVYSYIRVCVAYLSENAVNLTKFREAFYEEARLAWLPQEDCALHCEFWDNRRLVFIMGGEWELIEDAGRLMRGLISACSRQIDGIRLFLAVGEPVHLFSEIQRSYQTAHEAEKTVFHLGWGKFSLHSRKPFPIDLQEGITEEFRRKLQGGNEKEIEQFLEETAASLRKSEAVQCPLLQSFYYRLLTEIWGEYLRRFPEQKEKLGKRSDEDTSRLGALDTLDAIDEFLLSRIREMLEESRKDESNHPVILRVTRLIWQEYGRSDLSVKQLADSVYLTPTYLSALFKRKTGKTIGEYITSVRMEKAKELLRDPQFKLYHVSEQVGYEDPGYFAKIFKKQTGATPSEYREKNLI